MRYDAAIIGAGADGLAAAATLARTGLKTIVIERAEQPGGRCTTRQFHPGFHAAPFCDEIAPIPADTFWSLDLARRGVVFVPAAFSTALWQNRSDILGHDAPLLAEAEAQTAAFLRRALTDALPARKVFSRHPGQPWPTGPWTTAALSDVFAAGNIGGDRAAHLTARALAGRGGAVKPGFDLEVKR